ncbi:MAG: aldose epimerase family protein [Anaerotignum sp.]
MIRKDFFGYGEDGITMIERYTLENRNGTKVGILTLGASIQSFVICGTDIVLGFDEPTAYQKQEVYMGATIGRFANRIGNGTMQIREKTYRLAKNNGPNHLHGGAEGFDRKIWQAEVKENTLHLYYTSCDGEEGYPGNLETEVIYCLNDEDALSVVHKAKSDQDTIVNLTNHSYFNLNGHGYASLAEHEVQIFADCFTKNDENTLPTGEICHVVDTPMDFLQPRLLLSRIEEPYEQLALANGYDHHWIVRGEGFRPFLKVSGRQSGITMEIFSNQAGMQMYTGNYLGADIAGKEGVFYPKRSGVCFETQGFADAPNKTNFPSALLKAGELYERKTVFLLKKENRT